MDIFQHRFQDVNQNPKHNRLLPAEGLPTYLHYHLHNAQINHVTRCTSEALSGQSRGGQSAIWTTRPNHAFRQPCVLVHAFRRGIVASTKTFGNLTTAQDCRPSFQFERLGRRPHASPSAPSTTCPPHVSPRTPNLSTPEHIELAAQVPLNT